MSVPNQTPYNIYTANGLTTVFTYEFYIIITSDLQVSINGLVVTSGYTVAGAGNKDGGDITFLTPPATGAVVMLQRVVPTYRLTDYQDNGDLLADAVNKDFDRIWMAIQRAFIDLGFALTRPFLGGPFDAKGYRIENLADPVNNQDSATKKFVIENGKTNLVKTLRVPESSILPLPGIAGRKNKILAFNDQGNPIAVLPESGSAADVLIELAASDGAKRIGGLNYVTPEMSGFVTGAGNAHDDTAAIQWALNQNAAQVVLDSTKIYNIQPGVIQYTGKINVDAGTAKIVCDGVAIEIIDGAESVWKGGYLKSTSTPWTVIYDDNFSIINSGYLGYGRMPYHDDANVPSEYYFQQICCIVAFRASGTNLLSGLNISGVKGSYASVVAAGFENVSISNCDIRGGALAGAISIINDCQLPITNGFGWNGRDVSYDNPFKWARGGNHIISDCVFYEGRQQGLFLSGSDYISITNCISHDNAESGFQSGQYSAAYPEESIICKYVKYVNCSSYGNYYDGFDNATITSGSNGPYYDKHLVMTGCVSNKNRATGMLVQGTNIRISDCYFENNGTHGISLRDSSLVDISNNTLSNNGVLGGGYQLLAVGSDLKTSNNKMHFNNALNDAHLVNISVGNQQILNFGVIANDIPFTTYSSPDVVIGFGVEIGGSLTTQSGDGISYSGIRTPSFMPQPKAGHTEAKSIESEAGAVAAWKHPYSGAYMRMYADDLSGITSSPMAMSYNWGKNSANPNGYADNSGFGGTKISFNPTSIKFSIRSAGAFTEANGITMGAVTLRPNTDNITTCGEVNYRFTQFVASNSTIATCDADHKTNPRNIQTAEVNAFYEIGQLPWVWQWLHRVAEEGEAARLHSGPTVQAAIGSMEKHGLDWRKYSAFCYDEWDEQEDRAAGHVYSFRKEELLLWIVRATIEKLNEFDIRLSKLE